MPVEPPVQPLTVYLVKRGKSFADATATKAQHLLENARRYSADFDATLLIPEPELNTPKWLAFLSESLGVPDNIRTQSARALLHVDLGEDAFILTFGHAHHLIERSAIVRNFGLRVVLNEVPSGKIRAVDRTQLESDPLLSRTQSAAATNIARFGIDFERDLLSAATGEPADAKYGKRMAGADSLHLSLPIRFKDLPDTLRRCLKSYRKTKYTKEYPWVDNVREVSDESLASTLDGLVDALMVGPLQNQPRLCMPKVIDWLDVKGFGFRSPTPRKGLQYVVDLTFQSWIDYLGGDEAPTCSLAKARHVFVFSDATNDVMHRFTLYDCLSAEIVHRGETYLLHDGVWFGIAAVLVNDVDRFLTRHPRCPISLPNYNDEHEKEYNERVANETGMYLLDRRNISYGGGRSKVEACDLLTANCDFIHVKRASCGASGISHLCTQALVGMELLLRDKKFRGDTLKLVPASGRKAVERKLKKRDNISVIAAVCQGSQKALPFFGRIALRNMLQRFQALDVAAYVTYV